VSDLQEDRVAHHQFTKTDFLERLEDAAGALGSAVYKASIEGLDTKMPQTASNMPLLENGIEQLLGQSRAHFDQRASNKITCPRFDDVVGACERLDRAGSGDATSDRTVTPFEEQIVPTNLGDSGYQANTNQALTGSNTVLLQRDTPGKVLHGASRRQANLTFDVDLLTPADWRVLRAARLRALRDSPHAFLSSYALESSRSKLEWQGQFDHSTWIIAREPEEVIGLARSVGEPGCSSARHIESVWVAPTHRRRGICRGLIQTLICLEQRIGATHVLLWVLDDNNDAQGTYEALGFRPTGERQYLPSVGQYEFRLRLRIDSTTKP
jgi:ribosomal protein S18 acetylase RimI-like enzyme